MPHKQTDKESFTLATQYRFKNATSINVSFENGSAARSGRCS
jgi:hypothetical protein